MIVIKVVIKGDENNSRLMDNIEETIRSKFIHVPFSKRTEDFGDPIKETLEMKIYNGDQNSGTSSSD